MLYSKIMVISQTFWMVWYLSREISSRSRSPTKYPICLTCSTLLNEEVLMQNCFCYSRQCCKELFGFDTTISKYHTSKDCIHPSEFTFYNNNNLYYRSKKVSYSSVLAKNVERVFFTSLLTPKAKMLKNHTLLTTNI